MSAQQKARNIGQMIKGKAKEVAGKVTRNEGLTLEGQVDQAHGDVKQAVEKLKDAVKH